jgi:hypothetical protein
MITLFGRYRWARLPFGLKVSSEIFQRKLTEAVGDLNGTFTIAVTFLSSTFYTITYNFVSMKCYFFQSDFFLLIIQYNFLFFASFMQFGKFHLVIARSFVVGLTTPIKIKYISSVSNFRTSRTDVYLAN